MECSGSTVRQLCDSKRNSSHWLRGPQDSAATAAHYEEVLELAARSPCLAAHLAASGMLGRMLQGRPSAAGDSPAAASDAPEVSAWLTQQEALQAASAAPVSLLELDAAAAAALLQRWEQQADDAAEQLELAWAAAARSCAYLRCPNLAAEGGAFAGQTEGSKKCG